MVTMVSEIYSEQIDEYRSAEVHVDEYGQYWVGVTHIRDPKDWTFHPRYHTSEALAIEGAKELARGIRFDASFVKRS
jgi:hypothetical protein